MAFNLKAFGSTAKRFGGPALMPAMEAPFIAGDISHARKAYRMNQTTMNRLRRAERNTGLPFRQLADKYRKSAPAGPISSIGGSAAGLALGSAAGTFSAGLASPTGPVGAGAAGLVGWTAGYEVGRRGAKKLLAPLDKIFFQKQLQRTARIRADLEKYRGV